ncbi:MAG: restriction endonuclease subunit S [Cocleimonas sp.]
MAASKTSAEQLITDNIDVWTSAIKKRGSQGRGSSKKIELYGIKKLRELILELAVRGLLVPQDPSDEPASVLLEKIAAEKELLIKDGKIKKQTSLPEISEVEKPFELPLGWEWIRFGNAYYLEYGNNLPQAKRSNTGEYPVYGSNGVVGTHKDYCISEPCIVVGRKGSAGALNLSEGYGCWVTDVAYSIVPPTDLLLEFVLIQLKTLGLDSLGKGIKPGLNRNEAYQLCIAFPPEAEQPRIDAKVNELMALCDHLEQQTETSLTAHQTLVETLLNTLLAAAQSTPTNTNKAANSTQESSFDQAWNRIAQHFDVLFTTEHSIDQLKQTILQLAVMGKLVPQDPNDEPASVLLEKIAAEKEQLIKDKKIKKQKPLPLISDNEKPFELPNGWEFTRLGDLTTRLGSGSTPRGGQSAYEDSGVIFLRSQNVWNDGLRLSDTAYIPEETHQKMINTHVYPGDVLLNITGASLGRSTIFPKELVEANVSQHVTIIRLVEQEMGSFVHMGILSPLIQRLVWGRQVGMAIEGLSKKVLELFEFPVPPLAEQARIMEKVNQFMNMCDSLKLRIQQSNMTQLYLTDAIGDSLFGRSTIIRLEEKEEKTAMKISTELSLGIVEYDRTAILAPLVGDDGADAKIVWSKSKLNLPEFYKQLKVEITAGFVAKPAKAEFEG